MIKKKISRTTFQEHLIDLVRDEMYEAAIKDDGIYSTFKYHNRYFTTGEIRITLRYCKLDCDDKWLPAQRKIFYKDCPELGEFTTLPCICAELKKKVIDRIKMDAVKKDDALWSTIKVESCYDHFWVTYDKANYLEAKEDPHLTTSRYLGASDLEIENTKKTLRRLEKNDINKSLTELHNKIYEQLGLTESLMNKLVTAEGLQKCWEKKEKEIADAGIPLRQYFPPLERLRMNSYYGLYPRNAGTTYACEEKAKEDLKDSLKTWKASLASLDIHSPSKEFLNRVYRSHNKEEKEKKDMNITLMVVPEGMNKDFVRKVKANYQSNNSLRLFIASTDIDYSCEHEPIKTKYDLFEKWIKTGYVDVVYFMLGFKKDPDVRAFEAFVRGITEAEVPGKIDIRVAYQRDDILNDANNLRTAYFDEADAKEDLEKADNKVVKEAKTMQDIYGLDDNGLDIIKYSRGKIDASDELIIGKIMDVAFAEDEDAKPAKKGGKK